MSTRVQIPMKQRLPPSQSFRSAASGTLQRKCACGSGGSSGDCEACKKKTLQRSASGQGPQFAPAIVHDVLRSPGQPLAAETRRFFEPLFGHDFAKVRVGGGGPGPAEGLKVNQPGDRFELEAERTAQRVMRAPAPARSLAGPSLEGVRIHNDARASESARSVGALAYTVGQHIVFAPGKFNANTSEGRELLAHELTHTLQQRDGNSRQMMAKWDSSPACAGVPNNKWIDKIVVKQETPQTVNLHWTDNTTESGECSTGKGHCCADASNPTATACTAAGSRVDGSNCTPIGSLPVANRVADHSGVHFWTEIHPTRAIALHQYDDYGVVDGTPLSHGCVRLHEAMAKNVFCNVRQNKTVVEVEGFSRPQCDYQPLQDVWMQDFQMGGSDLSTADGDTKKEIVETRRELDAAFGRHLTPDQIKKFTASDIPRCSQTAPLPKAATTQGTTTQGQAPSGQGS
jgi:hypothetical protein